MVDKCIFIHSFFFIRILFFPAKAEYSYFSADFLAIFLIIAYAAVAEWKKMWVGEAEN